MNDRPRHPIAPDPRAVKAIAAHRRAAGTPVEAFRAALARTAALAPAVPGVRRYVRSTTIDSGYRKRDPVYDAVDELWFDDEAAARAGMASDEMAAIRDGLGADPAASATFLVRDHLLKDGAIPADPLKNFEFVTRRANMSVEDFRRYWLEHHGPLACGIPTMLHYVQSHAIDGEYRDGADPDWEGSAITWFADLEAMRRSAAHEVYAATRADEKNFLGAPLALPFIITTEQILVRGAG